MENNNQFSVESTNKSVTIKIEGNSVIDYEYLWDVLIMQNIISLPNTEIVSGKYADSVKFKRPTIIEIKVKR